MSAPVILSDCAPTRNVLSSRLVSIGQAAKFAAVHPETIRRYMASGLVEGVTTPGGHRRLSLVSIADAFGIPYSTDDNTAEEIETGRGVVLFARVSSIGQKADLVRQVDDLKRYADKHYPGERVKVLQGIGSGLNDSRKEFLTLVDLIVSKRAGVIICTYRERIARFGISLIQHLCKANGATIVETGGEDDQKKERTLQEDMIESCMAVLHCFSAKMNGIRGAARTKIVPPAGFKERVCQLAGSGLGFRDIIKTIVREEWVCQNTGRHLGERSVRNVLDTLKHAPIIPASVKTFIQRRCVVGAGKRAPSADLYNAYRIHCEGLGCDPLNRDMWMKHLKRAVPGLELDNQRFTTAYGITLRASR
jgi:putative resolvase